MSLNHLSDPSVYNGWCNINCNTITANSITTVANPYIQLDLSGSLSIPDSTFTPVSTMVASSAVGITYNTVTGEIKVPSAGVYSVSYSGTWTASATGVRSGKITITGNSTVYGPMSSIPNGGIATTTSGSANLKMLASGVITINVYQASGGALNLTTCNVTISKQ